MLQPFAIGSHMMRKLLRPLAALALVLTILVGGCEQAGCAKKVSLTQNVIDNARKSLSLQGKAELEFARGNYSNAIKVYRELLEDLPDATHSASLTLLLKLPDSTPYYRFLSSAQNNLGLAHFRLRQFESAASAFTQALRADSRSSKARLNLGILRIQQKQYAAALVEFTRMRNSSGSLKGNLYAGIAARNFGDWESAKSSFSLLMRQARLPAKFSDIKLLTEVHFECGLGYLEAGNQVTARRHFETALLLAPGNVQARYHLARTLAMLDEEQLSIQQRNRFLIDSQRVATIQNIIANHRNDPRALQLIADTYLEIGQYHMAFGRYKQWSMREPTSPQVKAALGKLHTVLMGIKSSLAEQTPRLLRC